eukprot:CAMPEP_0119300084 /NCGR_PEP_ID=MMETSP1333-20130426/2084_1 /TAXON_ID=418940 /ORGANISM="Scyphosphaera apsteinii, Strain RCC1455" /LENGTH=450 /DNA_ID=CAMNT_0007301731 /DNA_START=87 /DNA_END=1439 /DNA_ORIENTATION=-
MRVARNERRLPKQIKREPFDLPLPLTQLSIARVATNCALSLLLLTNPPAAQLLGGQVARAAPNLFTPTPNPSEYQLLAAEAWKLVDRNYADRTFAGQDWFETRQKLVKKNYDSSTDVYNEISKMLETLGDKYTRFLTPAKYKAVFAVATGDVAGIGVELAAKDVDADGKPLKQPLVVISSIVDNGPADKAGLLPGDVLESADGADLRGLEPEEAAAKVRGAPGSKIRLEVTRRGAEDVPPMIITRGKVKLEAVTSSIGSIDGSKVGLVRLKQFSTETAADMKAALRGLSSGGVTSFVIDLRGNTGGYFPGGVDVARLFLPKGSLITYTVDKTGATTAYEVYEDGEYVTSPVALLVDDKTASASEVLSGALHDNKRATLIGRNTFGKAVIQTVEELQDGSAVVVTIARYETPVSRSNINGRGIEVDVPVDCPLSTIPLAKAVSQCVPRSAL